MSTRFTRAAVVVLAGFSLLAGTAAAGAAGPEHRSRSSHRSHHSSHGHDSHRGHHHRSHDHHSHHRRSHFSHGHGHRSHGHHFNYPGRSSYHRSHNPYRFYRSRSYHGHSPHRSHSYHRSYHSYPSYSISFGYDPSCSSYSSIYRYGTSYSYPAYTYPKKYYDPYCRPYSSGVYLSYDTDVYVAADATPRSLTYAAASVRVIDATEAGPTEIGFKLLAAGEHSRALSFFADAASRDLEEPLAKLGYSMASAAEGNDDRALWAMRRAVQAGAAELPSWPECTELTELAGTLKDRYQAKADRYVHTPDRDALFMLAALNHVTGDTQAAKAALARSYPGGEDFYDAPTKALAAGVETAAVASK